LIGNEKNIKLSNFPKYIRKSFGAKIFFLFTTFFIVLYCVFTVFFVYSQGKILRQNLVHEGKEFVNLLAYSSRLGVFAENRDLLKTPVMSIMQCEEVISIQVFTVDGKELETQFRPDRETAGGYTELDTTGQKKIIDMLKKSKSAFHFTSGNVMEFWAPVISGADNYGEEALFFDKISSFKKDAVIGFVRIAFTTELLNKNLHDILFRSIIISVLFMIPGWIIIYYIARKITRPLNRLTEGVAAVGSGGAVEEVPVETKDEIGNLASAFNNMVDSLRRKEIEKQEIENQLRHAQKMEAIGTLAGGIAHDFNNTLSTIIGYAYLLQKEIKEGNPAKKYLDHLLSTSRRAVDFTQGLLTFSRKEIADPHPVDLNKVSRSMEEILTRLLGEDIDLKIELAEEELVIMADTGQIEQVLMNLATNARDAMLGGGSLTVATRTAVLNKKLSISSGLERHCKYAVISFTDTGKGMNEQTKEKIFDPFFTTKETGKGTGLGLSMVYGIIKQHNGYIDVHSEPGKGTTFKIYLPLSSSVIKEEESETLPKPRGGTETILVAEDDEDLRRFTTVILEQYGYKVIEVKNGEDAVGKFIKNKDKIKLLLFDMIMPKKNGKEAFEEIKKIRADIKVIFMSGYAPEDMQDIDSLIEETAFIPKPLLSEKLREVLDK
jgi:signal transduction histidine kinase/CheY-like chemotaxis protein